MRQFFRQTFASTVGTVFGLALFFGLSLASTVLLVVLLSSGRDETPRLSEKSVLTLDLTVPIRDTPPIASLGNPLSPQEPVLTVRQVTRAIRQAASDDRVTALLLDGSGGSSSTGYAVLHEVRGALLEFRESGKPVVAYDTDWSEPEYYLASAANRIAVDPLGIVAIDGFSTRPAFYAGALDQFGIGVQVVRVGDFKAAVEPFVRQGLSPENREQLTALLEDLWGEFVEAVSGGRGLEPDAVQRIADTQGRLLPEEAQMAGLVDEVSARDRVVADLKETNGSDAEAELPQVSLGRYATRIARDRASSRKIALVYAEGAIVSGPGTPESIGSERYTELFQKLREDDDVQAVVLRVNSPGGSATASELIRREIALTREQVPVVISMGNSAASGGYWIAMGGGPVYAEPTTVTGSIGVFGLLPNVQELANENGITWDSVKTGELADSFTITRPKTEAELELFQTATNQIYERFLTVVAESRDLPRDRVAELARGRVWSGEAAAEVGLVDDLGGLNAAIARAAEAAELGDNWQVREYPQAQTLAERLAERLSGTRATPSDPVTLEWQRLQQLARDLQTFNDPQGAYARLPFDLHID